MPGIVVFFFAYHSMMRTSINNLTGGFTLYAVVRVLAWGLVVRAKRHCWCGGQSSRFLFLYVGILAALIPAFAAYCIRPSSGPLLAAQRAPPEMIQCPAGRKADSRDFGLEQYSR